MSYYSKKMDRRDVLHMLLVEEFEKLKRKYPFVLNVFIISRNLNECGDREIIVELLNGMRKKVIDHNNKVVETWATTMSLEAKGELLEDREKVYRENLIERLVTLVGKDAADQWQIMNADDRWEAIQDMCEKFHWQFRVKYGKDQWICVGASGKILKQESNFRRVSAMPLNAYIRNPEIVTEIPIGKDRAELYALKSECLTQLQHEEKQTKLTKLRLRNITKAIAEKEDEEGRKELGDGKDNRDEDGKDNRDEDSDEDIRKLLRGD